MWIHPIKMISFLVYSCSTILSDMACVLNRRVWWMMGWIIMMCKCVYAYTYIICIHTYIQLHIHVAGNSISTSKTLQYWTERVVNRLSQWVSTWWNRIWSSLDFGGKRNRGTIIIFEYPYPGVGCINTVFSPCSPARVDHACTIRIALLILVVPEYFVSCLSKVDLTYMHLFEYLHVLQLYV